VSSLRGRTVALVVTGSIAAYKSAIVARLLVQAGARVVPVMTASAARFLGPVTLSGICGEAVASDMWDPAFSGEMHVAIADRADAIAIAPATADLLARLASGRGDDLATALVLCARAETPVLVAPAMHPRMWSHPATQANVTTLARQGRVRLVGPVVGPVASGDVGLGRMSEPEEIAQAIAASLAPRDLDGVRVVVTAGPTYEDLDPVRFLGNRSSGKMGFAIAERAAARGGRVVLVAGPVERATPAGVTRVDVRGAVAMQAALRDALGPDLSRADVLVMSAAVADYRPATMSATKLKKQGDHESIALVKNPDLLAEIGAVRAASQAARPILVGFALETGDVVGYARGKLATKRCDFVVANEAHEALGTDDNRATIVSANGAEPLPSMTKHALADAILDRVKARLTPLT
jgi:phosphopantothenoylcysteine decarboxylase/phosphopantothenate--cysteine ligase